jgi:hypothetical protein
MRRLVGVLLLVLLASLAGCGGDSQEDYCTALEERRTKIAEMVDSGSPAVLLDNLPMLRDLGEQAPEDLRDEWQTYLDALGGLDEALDEAGVKASEFKDGKPPAGLSEAERKAIADAAGQVAAEETVQAGAGIEQQARDVCKINLGL